MANSDLLVLGASVRAVAYSALRAGLEPCGADLFCDQDLPSRNDFEIVNHYPHGLLEIARRQRPGPWMYTGALENRPALVEKISYDRPLWGNPPAVLRKVRLPEAIFAILREMGICCSAVRDVPPASTSGRWLIKPRAGGGGQGIAFWRGGMRRSPGNYYFQEFIEGEPCSAVYLGHDGKATLLGVTRQLVGQNWLHAAAFHYCGSIGPLSLEPRLMGSFQSLGNALAANFHLRGLFGVDCVVRDRTPFPVEINPRYTASVEVLELAMQTSLLALHRNVFEDSPGTSSAIDGQNRTIVGKAILFAAGGLRFPAEGPWIGDHFDSARPWVIPKFADVPGGGQEVAANKPVLTFFAKGQSLADCEKELRRIAADLDQRLFGS